MDDTVRAHESWAGSKVHYRFIVVLRCGALMSKMEPLSRVWSSLGPWAHEPSSSLVRYLAEINFFGFGVESKENEMFLNLIIV